MLFVIIDNEVIWLKKVFAAFAGILSVIIMLGITTSYAGARDIRIGLERFYIGVGSIPISDSVVTVQIGEGKKFSVPGGTNAVPVSGSYFDSGLQFDDFNSAKLYTKEFDDAVPVLKNDTWGVYFSKSIETTEMTTVAELDEDMEISETTTEKVVEEENSSGFGSVTLGGNAVAFNSGGSVSYIVDGNAAVHISTGNGIVNLGSNAYRDTIEIYRNGNTVNAVNILPVEEYLFGVVTSEMPSSWPIEAIKAQTVAARTYVHRNMGKHGKYDLCDNTDCQQYNGVNGESSSGTQAVESTKGVMAYYNGALISATYFSSSGGHTQNAEDVWGTKVPYLVGVKEINETGGKQWVRTFTFVEMTELCKKASLKVGNVTGVRVGEALDGGFVKSLVIEGTEGSVTLEKEAVRELFKNSAEGSLYSRNFKVSSSSAISNNVYVLAKDDEKSSVDLDVISAVSAGGVVGPVDGVNTVIIGSEGEYVLSSEESNMTEAQDSVTITGSGYGHGVGMSQYGAKGMAELGYDYKEILKYYYTGIDVH